MKSLPVITAEKIAELRVSLKDAYKGILSDEVMADGNPWFEAFLTTTILQVATETMKNLKPTDNQLISQTCREAIEQNYKKFTE